jgi:hypothetical protein
MLKHPRLLVDSLVNKFRDTVPEVPQSFADRTRLRRALVQTQADDDRISEWKETRR